MSESTRRGFVKSSASAAAGMTVIGALVTEQADAADPRSRRRLGIRRRLRQEPEQRRDRRHVRRARSDRTQPEAGGADRPRGALIGHAARRKTVLNKPFGGNSMSSHREAPAISKDPVADNTDTYAFVSPDDPTRSRSSPTTCRSRRRSAVRTSSSSATTCATAFTSTTTATATPDISYQFEFQTVVGNPNTFLYNTGTINSISSPNWNRKQFYTVTADHATGGARAGTRDRTSRARRATSAPCPPRTTHPRRSGDPELPDGHTVFAGQRLEGFYVDLGSIFDLANLRPFENLHIGALAAAARRRRDGRVRRALDRAEGPDERADGRRLDADRSDVTEVGHRCVGVGRAASAR